MTTNGSAPAAVAVEHLCTADDPWSADKAKRAVHPDAECIDDGGWEQEYETYKCPHCGHRFSVTLPSH